ncbi:MAG: OadG family protein [Clostridia bacterium]
MSQFEYGIVVLSIGMTVVMTALLGLSLVMSLMKSIFYKNPNKPKRKTTEQVNVKPVENNSIETKVKNNDKKEIIAAISAAIAAYTGQEILDFNIISIKRVNRSEWKEAGKQELMQTQVSNQM